jgi:hypothetical protein
VTEIKKRSELEKIKQILEEHGAEVDISILHGEYSLISIRRQPTVLRTSPILDYTPVRLNFNIYANPSIATTASHYTLTQIKEYHRLLEETIKIVEEIESLNNEKA